MVPHICGTHIFAEKERSYIFVNFVNILQRTEFSLSARRGLSSHATRCHLLSGQTQNVPPDILKNLHLTGLTQTLSLWITKNVSSDVHRATQGYTDHTSLTHLPTLGTTQAHTQCKTQAHTGHNSAVRLNGSNSWRNTMYKSSPINVPQ